MTTTKGMLSKLYNDSDMVEYLKGTGVNYMIANNEVDEVEVDVIVKEIVSRWNFGGYFDNFGSNAGVQMVGAICSKIEKNYGYDPEKASTGSFFVLMRYMFKKIYKVARAQELVARVEELEI